MQDLKVDFHQLESGHWYWHVAWLGRSATGTHVSLPEAVDAFRAGVLAIAYPMNADAPAAPPAGSKAP